MASFPTLAVAVVYCVWNAYRCDRSQRETILRERVAFLLWTVAHQMD